MHITNHAVIYSAPRRLAAWGVHLATASGAVVGLIAIIAIARHQWHWAFVCMAITVAIDAFDGIAARAVKVKEVLPHFDGALLDNIVDYFTWVIVPASFLYEAHMIPEKLNLACAVAIVLASAYQFCQTEAKTRDYCFKGFPSYWNITVFYLFLLGWPPWINLVILVVLVITVFIPVKYMYPSRTARWWVFNMFATSVWGVLMILTLITYPKGNHAPYFNASLVYVAYYALFSAWLNVPKKR